jgi:extracellular matrix protein 14
MKPPSPTTLLSLLVLSPTIALAVATGPVSHSHSSPAPPSTWSTAFPHLRRLRDTAVELLFGSSSAPKPSSLSSTTWASVQSRFANQAVVRFNVSSREEERALREATDRLFLDIWALTPEYVDVRVRKAELKAALSLLPESLGRPFVVVEDVAKLVWGTYPQGKRWGEGRVGGRERGGIEEWEERVGRGLVAGGTRDGVDNMFFRDYQPLSVGDFYSMESGRDWRKG